jgi:hypothetical protein
MRRHGFIYSGYLLLAVIVTFPLALNLTDGFIGAPESDAYEYARHIWWYGHALREGLPLFSQPLLAYPDGLPGLWLWAIPLQSFPAWLLALVMPLPLAYNLTALFRLALNGWAMFYALRRLPGLSEAGALIGGTVFMLYPAIQGHLFGSHLGVVALWPVPLYMDALFRLRTGGSRGAYLRAGLFFVLSILGSTLNLVFVLFPLTLYILAGDALARRWPGLGRVGLGVIGGATLSVVFVAPALWEQVTALASVRPTGAVRFSADLLALVSPSFFAPHAAPWSARVIGTNIVEGYGYLGLVAGGLVLIGVWRVRAARGWLALALLAWVLSLGPLLKLYDTPLTVIVDNRVSYIPLPFAALGSLPILDILRTPGRFHLALGVAVAVMSAYGAGVLLGWIDRRWGRIVLTGAIITLITADYQITWDGFPTVPVAIPDEIAALRDDPNVAAVLNLPHDNLLAAKAAMYLQTAHHKPLIAGFVSRETPVSLAKRELLQNTLDPALLGAAGADVVMLFRGYDPLLDPTVYQALGTPFYEDDRLAAFRVPAADPPAFTAQPGAIAHAYAPSATWATYTADLSDEPRLVRLLLNGDPITYQTPGESLQAAVPLSAGYHTVQIALPNPCPDHIPAPALSCAPPDPPTVTLTVDVPFGEVGPVQFEDAIRLQNATATLTDGAVQVRLWWHFAHLPDDTTVRFVHLLDANGEQLAGVDAPLPLPDAGDYAEQITFSVPDDAPGPLEVYTGWYRYPSLQRLDVQSTVPGAVDNWVRVGRLP